MNPDVIVRKIIRDYMDLANDRIWLTSENIKAPTDSEIFVIVGTMAPEVIGVSTKYDAGTDTETGMVSLSTSVNIDLCSRGNGADLRSWEVMAAINSSIAVREMENLGFSLFRNPAIQNLSAIEGAGSLRRYRIQVIVFHIQEKTTGPVESYINFQNPEVSNG